MNLTAFIDRIKSYDSPERKELILEDLQELAKNRSLLSDHLLARIQAGADGQSEDLYNAYAFTLYECDRFMIRLVLWAPGESKEEAETFIYGLVHSHDFDLFVTGYCGDGYETVLRSITGNLGLQVGVRPEFGAALRVKVAQGASYHMRPFRDVHLQLPPHTLSGSLSLVLYLPDRSDEQQAWCFDESYVPRHAGLGAAEQDLYQTGMGMLEEKLDM